MDRWAVFRWFLAGLLVGGYLTFAALCATAEGEDAPVCPSYIGLCSKHWPCEKSLAALEGQEVRCIGWLNITFGKTCPCAREFLSRSGKKLVRIHIANGTCFPERGRRCGPDEPFFGETIASADRKLRTRNGGILRRYRRSLQNAKRTLTAADANTTVLLSLTLESPFSNRARKELLRTARKAFPGGRFVDSVLSQRCLPKLVCEKHGTHPQPPAGQACAVDTDGDDYRSLGVGAYRSRYARCEAVFLWQPAFNLLDPRSDHFVDPLKRTHAPTADHFADLRAVLR